MAQHNARAGLGRRQFVERGPAGQCREFLRDFLCEAVVVQVAGRREDHVAAVKAVAVVVEEALLVQLAHRL